MCSAADINEGISFFFSIRDHNESHCIRLGRHYYTFVYARMELNIWGGNKCVSITLCHHVGDAIDFESKAAVAAAAAVILFRSQNSIPPSFGKLGHFGKIL